MIWYSYKKHEDICLDYVNFNFKLTATSIYIGAKPNVQNNVKLIKTESNGSLTEKIILFKL